MRRLDPVVVMLSTAAVVLGILAIVLAALGK